MCDAEIVDDRIEFNRNQDAIFPIFNVNVILPILANSNINMILRQEVEVYYYYFGLWVHMYTYEL